MQAQNVESFIGPNGEHCTRTRDANGNVATNCDTGSPVTPGNPIEPRPQAGPGMAGPGMGLGSVTGEAPGTTGGPMGLPPEWNQGGQAAQPTPPQGPINIVGKWNYQTVEENLPEDVLVIFQPNGQYNQFVRFPKTPALGKQIVQIWGQYTLQGSTLSVRPAGVQVSNGPKRDQLCNVIDMQRCITPDVTKGAMNFELQKIDDNTLQTPLGVVKRLP